MTNEILNNISKKISLKIRLKVYFQMDYVTNINPKLGDADEQDWIGAYKYADENTEKVLDIVREWESDGRP